MLKKLFLLVALLIPSIAWGQSTTVSGQITDAGGQSWNAGTVTATFIPVPPFSNYVWTGGTFGNAQKTVIGTLTGSGAYSISVPSNTAISPSGTSWQIVVQSATTPAFTSTQNVTVTGATQTVNFTPSAISTGAAPGVVVYSTSEISTAVIGSIIYVIGSGIQSCSAASGTSCTTWSGTAPAINAASFGVTANAHIACDASFVNGSRNVVVGVLSPNSDSTFTQNDVGDIVFGTTFSCANWESQFVSVPQGTITSVTDATHAVVSIAATSSCTTSGQGQCALMWGPHDDGPALKAAFQAASANGVCGTLILPAGNMLISTNPENPASDCGINSEANYSQRGVTVIGQGAAVSQIIPLPTYSIGSTGIVFGRATNAGNVFQNFGIFGGGQASPNGMSAALALGNNSSGSYINVLGWQNPTNGVELLGALGAGATLDHANIQCAGVNNNIFMGSGGQNVLSNSSVACSFGASGPNSLTTSTSGGFNYSYNNTYGNTSSGGNGIIQVAQGSFFWSQNDFISGCVTFSCVVFNVFGTAYIRNDFIQSGNGVNNNFGVDLRSGTGAVLYISNTTVIAQGTGSTGIFIEDASETLIDQGGNKISGTSNAISNPSGGRIIGSSSFTGNPVAANLVPSTNWGTGAAVSAVSGSDAHKFQFTLTNGSAAVGASPFITFTYPNASSLSPFLYAPICTAIQVGGTQAVTATTVTLTPSSATSSSVVLTYNGTPTISLTEIYQVSCQ